MPSNCRRSPLRFTATIDDDRVTRSAVYGEAPNEQGHPVVLVEGAPIVVRDIAVTPLQGTGSGAFLENDGNGLPSPSYVERR